MFVTDEFGYLVWLEKSFEYVQAYDIIQFVCNEVTLCGWWGFKIQVLTSPVLTPLPLTYTHCCWQLRFPSAAHSGNVRQALPT